jgi:hypothetical protein
VYAGHFAAGLAIKAKVPAAPTWALLLGTGFLDVLFGVFVMLGIEKATMTPHVSPGFSLDFIDWSHSLLASLLWAALFAGAFRPRTRAIAAALAFAVFSHFLLDLPMHPPDLALWPHAEIHVGFGLWHRLPIGWWWIELAFITAACAYYIVRARTERTFGGRAWWACSVILVLHALNSPWLSAAKINVQSPRSASTGFIPAARVAGIQDAISATPISKAGAIANVSGSRGLISYSSVSR